MKKKSIDKSISVKFPEWHFHSYLYNESLLNLNCFIGSKVTAILLNGWILPTGGVALGRVCPAACTAGLFFYIDLIIGVSPSEKLFPLIV